MSEQVWGDCQCRCSCWDVGQNDDDGTGLILCMACRMNIHSGDRPRPRPRLVEDAAPECKACEAVTTGPRLNGVPTMYCPVHGSPEAGLVRHPDHDPALPCSPRFFDLCELVPVKGEQR